MGFRRRKMVAHSDAIAQNESFSTARAFHFFQAFQFLITALESKATKVATPSRKR